VLFLTSFISTRIVKKMISELLSKALDNHTLRGGVGTPDYNKGYRTGLAEAIQIAEDWENEMDRRRLTSSPP